MDKELEGIKRSWDLSAATNNRMKAVHFTINGEALAESIYDDIYRHIDLQLGFDSRDVVLEIGAGSSLLLERIARRVKVAVGTDISRDMLKLAPPKKTSLYNKWIQRPLPLETKPLTRSFVIVWSNICPAWAISKSTLPK